jgi:hypothetical protein
MREWIALVGIAAFASGCAGSRTSARTSDEQAREAYSGFRYHLACPDRDNCDNLLWRRQPWISVVSEVECVSVRRPGEVRCTFVVHEAVYLGEILHPCAGLFRREGEEWRMLSIIGQCFGLPLTD